MNIHIRQSVEAVTSLFPLRQFSDGEPIMPGVNLVPAVAWTAAFLFHVTTGTESQP